MTPAPVALLVALLAPALAAPTLDWRASVDEALAEAKRDGKVVFLAINMDHERANDWMVETHYRDPTIRKLAARTVNLFASRFDHGGADRCPRVGGGPPCAAHVAIDKRVRREFVPVEPDGSVIAPQHVFLAPGGEVLLSVPYQVTVGELEWCFVAAIRRVDPEFAWTLSKAARAPKRLVADGIPVPEEEGPPPELPPTEEEVDAILERSKKTARATRADLDRLVRSEEKRAVEFVRKQASSGWSGGVGRPLGNLLRTIGERSPESWWTFVAPFLEDHRPVVRRQAAVALEQLAVEKSRSKLLARWRKEDDVGVRGDVLRALAGVAPSDRKVIALVEEQSEKAREPSLRAAAVVAAAHLEDREVVLGICRRSLGSDLPEVRAAAAIVAAVRREAELRPRLDELALLEESAVAKAALEAALRVLDGGHARLLRPALRDLFDEEILRDRR